jgi:hypothetical protein
LVQRACAATTAEELLAELKRHNTETLDVGDDEARYGEFDELEPFLIRHGIAFDRRTDAKYEYDGVLVQFRPGMEEPHVGTATQDGEPVVPKTDLEPIRDHLRAGRWREAKAQFDELLTDIPPLAPLRIVDDANEGATAGRDST